MKLVKVNNPPGKSSYIRKSLLGVDGVQRVYGFRFRYNSREDVYYFDLLDDSTGDVITAGLKCTPLYDLFLRLRHLPNRPEDYILIGTLQLENDNDPGLNDLGSISFLYQFIPEG